MIQTKPLNTIIFTCQVQDQTFNFQIPAETRSRGAVRLTELLMQVCEELKPFIEAQDAKVFTAAGAA